MKLLGLAVALMFSAGVSVLVLNRWPRRADQVYQLLLLSGAIVGLIVAVSVLLGGVEPQATFAGTAPGGAWVFGVDALSAWFLLPVFGVGAAAGIFGVGYLDPERGHRNVALCHALFALLLVALVGVVTSLAIVPFLAAWEVMALSAYLLVMFEHEQAEVRKAGLIYIVLTHVSTLALIGMFAALSATAMGHSFSDLAASSRVPGPARTVALSLAMVGFGLKAGAVPLHFWLPGAHAAAPSHVSAVLSGVMLKVGIYGLFRVLNLVGPPPAWFGWTLVCVGVLSGVLGVLWALAQHDLKRLLAYHSVENIGIILLGMGIGVLGVVYGEPAIAVLGFAGALLHTLNHALFKSLLFLGAGAVLRATGTREIDRLGGLGRQLPWTALAFGVGAVAIVGLPPLNGFVSEWLVFQGLLGSGTSQQNLRYAVIGAPALALIGGLALACFAKLQGTLFLGSPRSLPAGHAAPRDPRPTMLAPMLTLAALCVVIGVLPGAVRTPLDLSLMRLDLGLEGHLLSDTIGTGDTSAITALGVMIGATVAAVLLIRRWWASTGAVRLSTTWGCAGPAVTPRMQYTASSFAALLLACFGPLSGVRESRTNVGFQSHAIDPVQDGFILPTWRRLGRSSAQLRAMQGGRLRWYLLCVVLTLLILLFSLPGGAHR